MKNTLPFLAILFTALIGAFVVVAGLALLTARSCSLFPRHVGAVLIYEVDPESTADPGQVDMQRLVSAIDDRINPGFSSNARVRQSSTEQIEISVFGDDPEQVQRIERLLGSVGSLEFRIVANSRDHGWLIDSARAQDDLAQADGSERPYEVVDEEGELEARWVPVEAGHEEDFEQYLTAPESDEAGHEEDFEQYLTAPESESELAVRETSQDGQRTLEVLVVMDPFDVDGRYLAEARCDLDESGNPRVGFSFDSTGATLFGRLTSLNLPDRDQGFYRKLGIILDGRLHSAPRIASTIYGRGVIDMGFPRTEAERRRQQEEVDDLVRVLNAGTLPARVRLVEKQIVGQ